MKRCKRRHSEIIVQSYNKEENTFHLLYYGMHLPKVVFESDVNDDIVYDTIKKSMNASKWGTKKLLEVRVIKKILKTTKIKRSKWLHVRITGNELMKLQSKANTRNLEVSDYIRLILFS